MNVSLFRRVRALRSALLLFVFPFCLVQSALAQSDPGIALARIDALRIERNVGRLDVTLEISNSRSFALELQHISFQMFLDNVEVGQGQSRAPVTIAAEGKALVPVSLQVDRLGDLAGLLLVSAGRRVSYAIRGIAEVGLVGLPVPFSRSGAVLLGPMR